MARSARGGFGRCPITTVGAYFSVADNSELFIGASRRKGKNQLDR